MSNKHVTLSFILFSVFTPRAAARAQSAQALIRETAKAMGGMAALRAIKNQVVESEGKQFDSSSTPRPLGPTPANQHLSLLADAGSDPASAETRMGEPQFGARRDYSLCRGHRWVRRPAARRRSQDRQADPLASWTARDASARRKRAPVNLILSGDGEQNFAAPSRRRVRSSQISSRLFQGRRRQVPCLSRSEISFARSDRHP